MNYPKTLLLFLDCGWSTGEPLQVPALGVHALSAYLRERDAPAASLQLRSPVPCREINKLVAAIGADDAAIAAFEAGPGRFLETRAAASPRIDPLSLRRLLDLWVSLVAKEGAGIVGLTLYRANFGLAMLLAARIKESLPDCWVVFGGPEVCERTIPALLRFPFTDALIQGEGEEALFQLVRRRADASAPIAPGIHLKDAPTSFGGEAPALEMARLPPPDFDRLRIVPGGMLPVEFNRGCVAKCRFCEETRFWRHYRHMPVARAVDNLRVLKERYGQSRFFLSQSLMNGDMDWLEAFAEALVEARLDLIWGGNARIHPRMDRDFLHLLRRAGCRFFHFGIESGSQAMLHQMKKGVRVPSISEVLAAADEVGLWNHTYWIFGYPSETPEDMLATADFISRHSHLIHSHLYHEYGDADAIGAGHPTVYAYLDAMPRMGSRCAAFYAEHRAFIRGLFRMERELLPAPQLAMKGIGEVGAEAVPFRRRGALLRTYTMGFLRRYIEHPGEREMLSRDLTRERFAAIFRNLRPDAAVSVPGELPERVFRLARLGG